MHGRIVTISMAPGFGAKVAQVLGPKAAGEGGMQERGCRGAAPAEGGGMAASNLCATQWAKVRGPWRASAKSLAWHRYRGLGFGLVDQGACRLSSSGFAIG